MTRFLLVIISFFLLAGNVSAYYDPLSVPNNKYGMHVADFNDLSGVAQLVNTNGGDWGYVTLVASDNDRDPTRWQTMFDAMRRLHLIPLVRLATHVEKSSWVIPNKDRLDELVMFFTNLNWPTENRYIILYNEPNHAKEWGDTIDPEGYADVAVTLAQKFKQASEDFFILPAGLDVSAANDGIAIDATEFLRRMVAAKPDILTVIDGWTSHSYPNPGFSGSPFAVGRGTLRTFQWELSVLQGLGLKKRLPVFITETGWQHSEGKLYLPNLLTPGQVAQNITAAVNGAWQNNQIVAITPFLFNYQDVPFDHFSWRAIGSDMLYPFADTLKNLEKIKGFPKQREEYVVLETLLPASLISGSTYTLTSDIQNNGQGILNPKDYEVSFVSDDPNFTLTAGALPTLEPKDKGKLTVIVKTPEKPGTYNVSLSFHHGPAVIPVLERSINVVAPPSLSLTTAMGWNPAGNAADVKVLIYDKDTLIHKFPGITIKNNTARVEGLRNIVPDTTYRIVIVVPYFLPRQTIMPIGSADTNVSFKRLLPLDIDNDGALTIKDLLILPKEQPHVIRQRFFGP